MIRNQTHTYFQDEKILEQFPKKDTQMDNKPMTRCPKLLATEEMQNKSFLDITIHTLEWI